MTGMNGNTMKALVKMAKGPGNLEVKEVPVPDLTEDDWVLIKVKATGVCGTDLHIWHDQFPYWPPVILGHEFSGEVVEIGKKVTNVNVGDRVVAEPHSLNCGLCEYCRQGLVQMCMDKRSPGWGIDGAFSDYVKMPAQLIHRIPSGVSYELAALAEPLAIAVHQVAEQEVVKVQDFVLVTGSGPIGILSAFIAKTAGADKVLMTGINSGEIIRFDVARRVGVDHTVNIQKEDLQKRIDELTGGNGADVLIETSGAPSAIKQGIQALKRRGRVSAIGLCSNEEIPFPWNTAMHKVLDLRFNFSSSYTSWNIALKLLQNKGDLLSRLITHSFALDDWEETFNLLELEKGIKAIYTPD